MKSISLIPLIFLALSCKPSREKPNVLMISIDDLNDWVGCMGGNQSAITPNIDRLASEGVLFTNAHCQTALCGPSRASIMSGLRPSTSGIYGQLKDNEIRTASDTMKGILFLPEYFGKNGYKTMGIGKIFHEHAPDGVFQESGGRIKGFGPKPDKPFHWNKKGTATDWGAFPDVDQKMPDYQSAQWAISRLQENHDRPFFLSVGFLRPHVPWYVPKKWFDMHPIENVHTPPYLENDRDDLPEIALQIDDLPMMPSTKWAIESGQWKSIVQSYLASTSFVDYYVGQVLEALEKSPYRDNTIVILWSDHGYRLGEKGTFAKHCLWQEGTNVPLIVKPITGKRGLKVNVPVELLDIYPTLLELCGLTKNERNEGKSLKPLLTDPKAKIKEAAISTYGRNNHAIITEKYRYIHYENGAEELYDREDDPNEWTNLASEQSMYNTKQALQKLLPKVNAAWSEKVTMRQNEYFIKATEKPN
ncbi:sulfatase [Marinilongibacter aquaticus]|uniref:sulfatase n=1 Tax=Marinilongibacter aquaticus TaxID=2975157 RepID=UPI0021BD31DA|nr:sulfatase [Marinilongibacter aquaticus]UBM58698.1 sulfatase [Marinilongibacter aquaticus]